MQKLKNEEVERLSLHLQYLFDHGVDFKNRVIQLCPEKSYEDSDEYEIDTEHFAFIDAAISEMESHNRKAITIRIHSYGGSVKAALAIIGRLKSSKCKIITEGYGTIESAATLVLACGDERRISKYSTFMHHEMSLNDLGGRLSQIQAEVKQADLEDKQWAKWMAEFSNRPPSFYMKNGKYVDVYWTPKQLLEYGIVDKLI